MILLKESFTSEVHKRKKFIKGVHISKIFVNKTQNYLIRSY